jgi:hypothetical protein
MDEKFRIKAIDAALANLRQQLIDRVPHMPDHWDGAEIGWLLAHLADWNRSTGRELDLRLKAFNNLVRHNKI